MTYTYRSGVTQAVTNASAEIGSGMTPGVQYRLYASKDAWFRIGLGGAATVGGTDCHPIKGGTSLLVSAQNVGTKITIIRDSEDGSATLSELHVQS
jgi:hypothetical protein